MIRLLLIIVLFGGLGLQKTAWAPNPTTLQRVEALDRQVLPPFKPPQALCIVPECGMWVAEEGKKCSFHGGRKFVAPVRSQ